MRTNISQLLFALSFTVFINTFGFAQDIPKPSVNVTPEKTIDTSKVKIVNLTDLPVNEKAQDTTTQDSVKPKPEFLTDKVAYKATDYVSINQKDQKIYLYNEAEVIYGDMQINAGIIVIDYKKNEVYAGRLKDSLGNYSQLPIFKQGTQVVEPDSIRFNFDTEKALVFNSRTEQQGFNIIGDITKKENDSVVFMSGGRFTTSKDPENPEYYFQARKIKFVPNKKIVTGLTNMVIADVPTPIGLPFAFFPLTNKQTSGVILPSFGEQNDRGYFLQNGGYYFAISDYFDLALLGDYYTNGSYALRSETNYARRYRFRGNLSLRYENLLNSERGFPDFSQSSVYNIRWTHSQDAKASPSSRFSASVNLGSSTYYQQSLNQLNVSNFLNNSLSSSVSYSKAFQGEPQVNISLTATHSQNSNTEEINMTLPTFQGSVSRVFPFAPKAGGIKKGIIQNINLQYNIRGENRITTTDSLFFKKEMFDDAKAGFQHTIPLSTNFKILKYFSLSASTNFVESWTFNTINRFYDADQDMVITEDVKGFDAFRTYNFSTSIGTTLYGMYDFGKDKKVQAIRHVMRPSISYNINPAFDQFYETYEVIDADGTTTEEEYTRFEGSLFGTPSNRYSSTMGISLGNNIEAKVRDKDTLKTEAKKITILNNLNFSTAYNFAADSLRWSPIQLNGGTQIFNNKMSINFNATLDPYALDNNNRKVDRFNIDNGGSLFRLSGANVTMNYSFSNSSFGKNKDNNDKSSEESVRSGGRADDLFGKAQDFSDRRFSDDEEEEEESNELYSAKIPWNVRLAYSLNYSNAQRQNEISSSSLMFSGDVELSPRWSVGGSSGYDFKNSGFTYTQLRFERDLLSWKMNFSWVPFSTRSSWYFLVGIKSSILSDIKYDKRRQPDRQL